MSHRALVFHPPLGGWLAFERPERTLEAKTPKDVIPTLAAVETFCSESHLWAVGWVAYEAASGFDPALDTYEETDFPLVWFGLFRRPEILATLGGETVPVPVDWHAELSESGYMKRIAQVRGEIQAGDTYQANVSFRLRAPAPSDPFALFRNMVAVQRGDYSTYVDAGRWVVCSASPELFFLRDGDRLTSRPMKGTSAPGRWPDEGDALAEKLRADPKNQAENTMIVDMVRNDLARIAERGSVRVTEHLSVERYPNLLQMTSEIEAGSSASLAEVFAALFPAASITGAPKVSTMELLTRVEVSPRRVYTGALGVLEPSGRARFNVAIRTALVDREAGTLEYGVGSGVVWDSDRVAEYRECMQKATAIKEVPQPMQLFETILWTPPQGLYLLEYHLERMLFSAGMLGFPVCRASLESAIECFIEAAPKERCRVKLSLARDGAVSWTHAVLTELPTPYKVALASWPVHTSNRFLYHKTTCRDVYDSAVPIHPDAHDVILYNERGELTESRIANLVLELDGERCTPPVGSGLLPGCARKAALISGEICERVLSIADLERADRIYLMNSLRGMWPVQLLRAQE